MSDLFQHTLRCVHSERDKTQQTDAMPPKRSRAPEKAHDKFEYMSFGVIASWHIEGFEPSGTIIANWIDRQP